MRSRLALAIVGLVATGSLARADDLADARRYAAALDYDRAFAVVDGALRRGGNDPARVVELHLLAGELAAGLDRVAVAEDHFARALALRSDAHLAPGASPKLTAPFEAARARNLPPLRVHVDVVPGLARIAVDDDPLGLVAGIAVDVIDHAGAHGELLARDAIRVAIPAGVTAVEVAALDGDGNRLWIGRVDRVEPEPARPVIDRGGASWWSSWSTWAIAGAAAAVAGGVFGWRMEVAQDDYNQLRAGVNDYSAVSAVESRGRAYAIAADVGFGAAAAAGVTALVLALRHHDDRPSLAITARDGRLGFGVGARF